MSQTKVKVLLASTAVAGVALLFLWVNNIQLTAETYSENPTKTANSEGKYVKPKDIFSDETIKKLSEIIDSRSDLRASVSVIDLASDQKINVGSKEEYTAASTTKLLSVVAYLNLVETGEASMDKPIGGQKPIDLFQRMLNQSDNSAWAVVDNYITYPRLEHYAHEIGIPSYDRRYNTITAEEATNFLQKMYKGQLVYVKNINQILPFMQNTDTDDLIPPALPSGAVVHHKAGYLYGNMHDIALVEYKDRVFAMSIFTNNKIGNLSDRASRVSFIQKLTRTIFSN